jgi:sphingolipid delta-4 desaturase
VLFFDYLVYKYWGSSALIYNFLVAYVAIGPHPAALHGLAEHYEFVTGVQTYDYIGVWNIFNLNVGYHIEHHDFPVCPWYNLPKIRKIAP